jgi:hypothetical protein
MLSEQYTEVCKEHFEKIDEQFDKVGERFEKVDDQFQDIRMMMKEEAVERELVSRATYEIREKLYNGIIDKVDSLSKWRRTIVISLVAIGLLMGPNAVKELISLIP